MAENTACEHSLELEVKNELLEFSEENCTANKQSSEPEEEKSTDNIKTYELEVENELRVLVGGDYSDVKVLLASGLAEIYGTEMELNKEYSLLPYSTISIFTWHGCVINVSGNPEAACVVKDSAMILNVILHAKLQERRLRAEMENKKGPVILVVGPNDVDKSSLCRLLLNYAVRLGQHPTFIDLDVGQTSISLPSSFGVLTVKKPADIITGFGDQALKVYQFGYKSPWQNITLYFLLLQRLGLTLRSDLNQSDQNVKTSGVIISGCDWSECDILHHGYNAITLVAMHFEIDILCVLQEEPLYLQLKEEMSSSMEIIFIPEVGGFERNEIVKSKSREACMRQYFFGLNNQLGSYEYVVQYSDIKIFEVVARSVKKYTRFLSDIKKNDAELRPIELSSKLIGQILGLSCADDVTEDLMYKEVVGFICISKVDMETKTISVISPQPGPLPKKILLLGDTKLT
ncbi:Polyribonucleotide 5'-hydroxyl-kinase Clp1 [Araneus ventricosus]|uniref:Polyribonucleotide 5'-hydroxyl-kinase Clp1 n=1 Tax=Araneus ventricosus TaxID=182803 RepID=A0A4Y2IR72_ARAVE|nr:Polyribonucleotide 5'-hydroxyl-kinase Clp1 [Araneus ventricosus]